MPPEQPLPVKCNRIYQIMWANNGDSISRQYAGTAALKVSTCSNHLWVILWDPAHGLKLYLWEKGMWATGDRFVQSIPLRVWLRQESHIHTTIGAWSCDSSRPLTRLKGGMGLCGPKDLVPEGHCSSASLRGWRPSITRPSWFSREFGYLEFYVK